MRYHYLITDFDREKMLRLPENEEYDNTYKEARFFVPDDFIDKFLYNIFEKLFDNKASLTLSKFTSEFSIDYQLSGDDILKLAYYGVTITEFSPKKRDVDNLKSRLADEVATFIKSGYYEEADKIYTLIKDL